MIQNSFKTLQEALLLSLEEKLIDDEEFALLYEEFTPQNLPFRHGDPAYPLRTHLLCPLRHEVLTRQTEEFNPSIISVRTSVEWLFGDLINYFQVPRLQKKLKIGLNVHCLCTFAEFFNTSLPQYDC